MMMKKLILTCLLAIIAVMASAQTMKGYYYNDEYQLYLRINAEEQNVVVPDQEIYGELPGYFGSKRDGRLWLITEAKMKDKNKLYITVINDYGSEDFEAVLSEDKEHRITMKHKSGSTFKIVVNKKYVKIPKEIVLVLQEGK